MNALRARGIVLSRTNYGEADRILTILTPDYGKLRVLARGVRKIHSKLAGGIELFSVSYITFIRGRGELSTLISTRLDKHYGNIVADLNRTMLGYELIKQLNYATEDEPGSEYFELLRQVFAALDDYEINTQLIKFWFGIQLLKLSGHSPNLKTDNDGKILTIDQKYNFDLETMTFVPVPNGRFNASHVKFLRLGFSDHLPKVLQHVNATEDLLSDIMPLAQTMIKIHINA